MTHCCSNPHSPQSQIDITITQLSKSSRANEWQMPRTLHPLAIPIRAIRKTIIKSTIPAARRVMWPKQQLYRTDKLVGVKLIVTGGLNWTGRDRKVIMIHVCGTHMPFTPFPFQAYIRCYLDSDLVQWWQERVQIQINLIRLTMIRLMFHWLSADGDTRNPWETTERRNAESTEKVNNGIN